MTCGLKVQIEIAVIPALNGFSARFTNALKETFMTKNVGGIDRIVRVVTGLTLIALAATSTVGWWGYLGVLSLTTAALGSCPPYPLFGWNTCTTKTPD